MHYAEECDAPYAEREHDEGAAGAAFKTLGIPANVQ
jgi:hypothetical protein